MLLWLDIFCFVFFLSFEEKNHKILWETKSWACSPTQASAPIVGVPSGWLVRESNMNRKWFQAGKKGEARGPGTVFVHMNTHTQFSKTRENASSCFDHITGHLSVWNQNDFLADGHQPTRLGLECHSWWIVWKEDQIYSLFKMPSSSFKTLFLERILAVLKV